MMGLQVMIFFSSMKMNFGKKTPLFLGKNTFGQKTSCFFLEAFCKCLPLEGVLYFIFQTRRLGFILCSWLSVMSLFPEIVTVDVRRLEACRIFLYAPCMEYLQRKFAQIIHIFV